MKIRNQRNNEICAKIDKYRDTGFMCKEAIDITARLFYLAPSTVRDIYYKQRG